MGFPYGILLFILTKWQVDKDLMNQKKTGQNTQASNMGEYESQRFRASSQYACLLVLDPRCRPEEHCSPHLDLLTAASRL